jgi:hypothetical protein
VIELCAIDRSREHVEAVLQHQSRPAWGLRGRPSKRFTSQLLAELLGE